jgi:hypothetical protein
MHRLNSAFDFGDLTLTPVLFYGVFHIYTYPRISRIFISSCVYFAVRACRLQLYNAAPIFLGSFRDACSGIGALS